MAKSSKGEDGSQPPRSKSSRQTERFLREQERARLKRERGRVRADIARQREYERRLNKLEKFGAYNPKSHELTRYRKTRINATFRDFEEFMNKERFAFVKLSPQGLKYAKQPAMNMKTTKRGAFVEKEGYEKIYERKSRTFKGETEIRKAWKAKTGQNKGKWLEDIEPLVPLDKTLADERQDLRRAANAFGPLAKNERLTFIIRTGGISGYSYNTYEDIDQLIDDIVKRYKRSDSALVELFAHLIIRKTTLVSGVAREWNKEAEPHRPVKKRKRKGKHYGSHKGRG